jgi:nucleotide-binding universal stress UspA family protein
MFNTILIPVDGSQPSTNAVALAGKMAAEQGGKLILAHALHHTAAPSRLHEIAERLGFADEMEESFKDVDVVATAAMMPGAAVVTSLSGEAQKEFGEHLLKAVAAKARQAGAKTVETLCIEEAPAKAILDYAGKHDVDLIVIGSRGAGKLEGFLLGSVSQKVVEESECPCLVVK